MKAAGPGDPAAQPSGGDSLIGNGASSSVNFLDSDFLNDTARGAEATSPAPGSDATIVASLDARSGDDVHLTDLSFMYEGSFIRQGSDLLLMKPDGTAILIENYFAADPPPDIVGEFGRRLTPELVDSFLMPMAPGQTAALTDEQVAQAQGNAIGTVDTLTGEVYAIRPDGTRVLLQAGDPVFQGDQVETADGGSLKITFVDGTIFTLGADARLALDEMVYDPGTQTGQSAFSILKGGFLFVSGQIAENNPNDMQVSTPVATIGIRGTIVTGEVAGLQSADGETFRFTVVDGEIAVSAGNQTIVLSDNFSTVSAQPDASTGQLRVFDFVDTAENVIARNSSQFRALTSNDLSNIERAIESSIQTKTGATVNIDLRGIVENVTREQQNQQQNNEFESDDQEEGPEGVEGEAPPEEGNAGEEAAPEGEEAPVEEDVVEEDVQEDDIDEEEDVADDGEEVEGGGDDPELTDKDLQDLEGGGEDGGDDPNAGQTGNEGDGDAGDDPDQAQDTEAETTNVTEGSTSQTVTNADAGNTEQNNGDLLSKTPGFGGNNSYTQGEQTGQDDAYGIVNGDDGTDGDNFGGDSQNNAGTPVAEETNKDEKKDEIVDDVEEDVIEDTIQQLGESALDSNNTLDRSQSTASFNVNLGSSTANVTVRTGSGNDTIKTGSGNDTVRAGAGNDTIIGGTGNGDDFYDGEDGSDTLTYDSVTGTLTANLTMEMNGLLGTSSIIDGTASVIDNDTITGVEHVRLGDGNDIVYVNTAGVNVDGDAGTDTVSFASFTINQVETPSGGTFSFLTGVATRDSASSTFTNMEAVEGGSGDDSFTLSNLLQSASGGSGTDTLSLEGLSAGQTLTLGSAGISVETLTLDAGTIGATSRSADYSGFEKLIATDHDDVIYAEDGVVAVDGGDGDDRLVIEPAEGNLSVSIGLNGNIQNIETLDLSSFSNSTITVDMTPADIAAATSDGTLHIIGAGNSANNIIRPGSGWTRSGGLSAEGNLTLTSGEATLILDSNALSATSNGTVTFTGTSDDSWQNSENWRNEFADGVTPISTDTVILENTGTRAVSFSGASATVGSISGSTEFGTDGLIVFDGTLTVTNGVSINDTVQGGNDGKLILQGDSSIGTLDIDSAELEIAGSAVVTAENILIDGTGEVAGSVAGTGTLVSTGTVTFAEGHNVNISATVDLRDAELFNNAGTNDVTIESGGRLIIDGDTEFLGENPDGIDVSVASLGVLEIGSDGTVSLNDGLSADFTFFDQSTIDLGGVWENEGTFTGLSDAGNTAIIGSGTLINAGSLEFNNDRFDANLQNSRGEAQGAVSVEASSSLTLGGELTGGDLTLGANSQLRGTGSAVDLSLFVGNSNSVMDLSNLSVTGTARLFGGTLTGTMDMADGQLDVRSDYEIGTNGVLYVGSDTSTSETMFGAINVSDKGTVAVAEGETADLSLFQGFQQGTSTLNFQGGKLQLDGNAEVSQDSSFLGFESASITTISGDGTLTNAGTLGFNQDNVLVEVVNASSGTIDVEGTMTTAFSGGMTNNGFLDVHDGATLSTSSDLTNSGTLSLSGKVTGVGTLTNTTAGVIEGNDGTLAGFVENLGVLTGSGTITGSFDSTDGTISLSSTNFDIADNGTLLVGSDTEFEGNYGSVRVNGGGTVEVAEGETFALPSFGLQGSESGLTFQDSSVLKLVGDATVSGSVGLFSNSDSTTITGSGVLRNAGTLGLDGDRVEARLENEGQLNLDDGVTVTGTVVNTGTATLFDEGTLTIDGRFQNDASFELEAAQLQGTGVFENNGSIFIDESDATLFSFDLDTTEGSIVLSSNASLLAALGSTLTVGDESSISGNGTIQLTTNSKLHLEDDEQFIFTGGEVPLIQGGPVLDMDSGTTITGTGTLSNRAGLEVDGATLSSASTLDNEAGMTVGSNGFYIDGDMTNEGQVTANGHVTVTATGSLDNNSTISIATGDRLSIMGDASNEGTVVFGSGADLTGSGTMVNTGHLTFGAGSSINITRLESHGTLDFSADSVSVVGGLIDATFGTFEADDISDVMTVSGGGVIRVGSMTEFGSFGTLFFSTGGTLSIAEDEVFDYGPTEGQWLTLTLGSGSTIDGPGTYQVTGSQFFDGVTLASGGRIDNDGNITLGNDGLTINGDLDNSGGTMNVASNSTITLNSGGTTSLAGSIALGGGVQIQGGSTLDVLQITGRLSSNGDASNQDTISANLEVSETGSIVVGGSNGQDGSLVITGNFVNNGFVQVDPTNQNVNGVLLIDNDFVNSGTLQVDNAATLIVGDSNDDGTIDGGGMMTNSGTLMGFDPGTSEEAILRLGSIANTGKIALPGNGQGDAARMTFQGTHINSMSGALALGMGAVLTLSNSTLAVASGTTYENDNGTLVLGSGGVLDIGGSHSVTSSVNSTIVLESGASIGGDGTLVNQGLMNLDGVIIDSVFDNVSTEGGTGDISLFSGEELTVHGRLINRDGAGLIVTGGTLSGTGTVEHQGTFTTNGATIDDDLRFEGAMRISGTGTAFTVDGLARGNIIVNATTATAIDGDGVLEITGGEISGAGLRLSTGVDVLQVGVLTFGSTSGRISVVSSDWVFGDQAGFTDSNGTLTINGGARIGVAENVDFHYDSTSMAHLQLASGGTAEMFGDGTFTNAGGTLTAGDGTLNLSIDRFVNEAVFNVDTYVMVGEDTHLSNTATLNVLSGTLASQGILANAGTLNVSGSVVDIHNGIFTNTGEINLDGNNGTAVLYSSVDFTNNGLIRMDESGVGFGAEIDMYNYNENNGHQTLTNAGTIEANNSSERVGLDHLIAGNLINTGLIDVNNDLNFGYVEGTNGFSLDTRDGAIAIEGGQNLSIRHDNSLIVGADTTLSGNGEIDMISGSTLSVATGETFAFDSTTGPDIRFNGTGALDGGGTFSNTGGTLTIDSNTMSVSVNRFENAGTVNIEEANVSFTGMDFANSGQLNVLNGDVVFADTLTATNSGTIGLDAGDNFGAMVLNGTTFTNTGAIVFDSSSGGNYSSTLEGLSNAVVNNSGRIVFANSGGGILRHKLESDTTNTGTITVNDDTRARFGTSEGASGLNLDSRDGRIEIGEDGTLEVSSTLTLGNDSAVTGDGTLAFQNGSTLSIAQGETFTLGDGTSTTSDPATVVAPVSVRTSNAFDPTVKVLSDGRIMTTTVTSDGGTIHIQVRDPATNNVVDGHSVGVNTSNVYAVTQLSDGTFRMVTDNPQVSNNRIRVYNFDDEFAFNGSQAVSTTVPAGQRFDDFEIHPTSDGGYIIVGQNIAAGEIRILYMNNDDTVLETVSHAVSGMDTGLDADVFPNGDVVVYYGEDNGSAVNRKAVFVDADDQTTTLHHIGGAASDSDAPKAVAVLDATTYVEASVSSHFGAEVFIRKAPGSGVNTIQLPDFDPDTFAESIDVTAMTDGGFAVAWSVSNGTDVDVYVQRYNASGEAIGDPINATQAGDGSQTVGATGDQTNVRIDMINGTEFVVIYENGSGAVSYSRGTFGAVVQAEAQPTMTFSGTFEVTGGVLSNETETDISTEVFQIGSDAELRNSGSLTFDAGTMEIASLLNEGSLSNSGFIDFVSGTLTSNGSLTNTGTISVGTYGTIQNQGELNNAGTLNINGGDLESLSGGLTNTGEINLTGSNSNSVQFVTGDMTNDGTIQMDDDGTGYGARIDLYDYIEESGHNTLTNAGTITVNNTGEGQSADFSIVGYVINTGRININTELTYGYSEGPNGFALDTRDGTINVASDSELTIRYNNTLVVGSDTEFTGSGTLDLREDSSLIVANGESFTYDSASAPVVDFGGTVAISGGTFTNAAGSTLTAGSYDDVSLSATQFINNGVLEAVNGGAFTIFTSNFNNSQGTLNILGDSLDSDLYIRSDMSLGGVIRLDGGSGTITDADLDTFDNTLTVTGTLHSTSQNSMSTEDNDLYGHFVNQGLFDIDQDTELEGSDDTLDSRDGTIDVASGKTFEIDGSLTVGTDTRINGSGTVAIDESHFIVADSEHFTHTGSAEIHLTDGILEGAGTFTNYGAVTFDSGTLSSSGTLAVNFFSNYGQFTAGQGTLTLATSGFGNETEGVEGSTGTFTLDAGSIGTSTVKLDEDFQNAGVLELTGSGTLANAVLTHTSSEIVENSSQGTILITSVGDAGGRTLDLGIENLGTIDVGVLTTLTAGHTLDNSAGTIALGANGTLEILGELTMGQSSKINSVAGGLIDVKGTLSVAEDDTATNEGGPDDIVLSDGATLAGLGTFRNVGDVELSGVTLAISAIDNDGTLRAQDGTLDLGTTTVIDNTGGTISAVSSFSTGAIEISESATLGGKILLDIAAGTDGASLTVAAGESLTVSGVLQTAENVPFGLDNVISEHTITGSIVNTGTFDIDHSTNIFGDLDSTEGDIEIAASAILNIKSGHTLTVGDDTDVTGDGTLKIKSGAELAVTSGETFTLGASTDLEMESDSTLCGAGTLAIATGHDQNIDGVTLSVAAVDNDGTLSVEAGAAVTLAATTLSGDGVLEINSSQVSAGNIVLTGNATNAAGHTIALTNNDTTLSTAGSITTANGSTLVNLGVITGAASAGSYAFAASIANAGAILLSDSATLYAGRTLDTSDGTLTITEGEVLGLNGNLILGADTELDAQLNLGSSGTVSVADGEVFTFDGNGNQGLSFVSGGTISGTGTFRNTDALFDLANGKIGSTAVFDNDAKVSVSDGEGIIATANFDNTGGTIEVSADDTDAGTLTINSNMTNAGLLEVDLNGGGQLPGLDATIRTTGGGHLTNTGTFLVQNSGFGFSGQLNLGIDVTNTGLISFIGNVDLGSGRVLDTTDGTLLVTNDDFNESSTELTMNGSTLVVGTDTVFGTANEATAGTINIGSGGALKLTDGEDFTYGLNTPILNFESGGSITGTGEMTVTGSLNLTGATIGSSVIIDNDGDIYVQDGALTLRPSNIDNAGGTLFILSDTSAGSVSISNSGTLAGTVILGTANNGNDDSTLSVGSGQVLTLTGTLVSQDEASSGLSHEVFGTVVNRGLVLVEAELNINDHLDSTDGDISITPNQTLDLDGTLSLGTDTDLLGSGVIFVDGGAVLNVQNDENFTYAASGATFDFGEQIASTDIEITGGGTFTNQTELHLSEDVTLSINQLVNDGGTIGILDEGLFLDLSGTTITNQNNGVFNVGTLTGTGRFTNETNMTITSFVADGAVTLVNNGTFETDSGTIVLTGASASMTIGTTGTLSETGVDSMTIQMNDGASVENRGLITLSDSSGTALILENDGTGNGTFANTGTIDFGTSSTEIRIRDGATMSIRAGTTFAGAAGIIALTNGGALAFDTDFTLSSSTFVLDSVSEGGNLPLLTGTGTLTNTGGIDNFGFLNIDVAKFVNQATVDAGTSTISTNDFVNDAIGTMEIASETLTINGAVTNNGLFQIGNGAVTGTGAFNNAGQLEVIASVTDVNANFTGLSTFTNSGTLTLKSTSSGDIPTLTVGDFVNSGTISFESGNFTDAAVLKLGASGGGTLTNEGLITNILSRDITVPSDAFTIMGDVTAGDSGGTIHVVDYVTVAGGTDGSLAITGDLTLNENSTTIIESGSGSIGGVLNVQGTLTYAGAFELRIDTGLNFVSGFEAVRAGTAIGSPDRIRILDSTGTTDFGLNQFGKLVLPNFNNDGNLEFQFITPTDILSSAGSLIGDTGHENVLGSVGDDIMTTGSDGRSRFYGRGGNDSFTLSASAETDYVDGGIGGRDIIYTDDLNFGDYEAWRINNIEALDFSGAGSGTISMNQEFIYGISEDINEILNGLAIDDALKDDALIIEGDSGQTLALDQNDWTATGTTVSVDHDQSGSSSSYAIYSASNGAHAFVDTDMQVNLAATPS
ncbi:FecR domain-containing protein [Pacificispira sp.]|uniref:FecR domain-containing protein n=1 Tax=Pacificispira sp. TaxID=2888761 RepID=UPI003BAA2E55